MEFIFNAWNYIFPFLVLVFIFLSLLFLIRFTQKQFYKLILKIAGEIQTLFTNNDQKTKIHEQSKSAKIVNYLSLILSSLLSIFVACFVIGTIMIYAVSEALAIFEISLFSSFFKIMYEWILLLISSILLIFTGIYASKFISFYINKTKFPHAQLMAQFISAIMIMASMGLSISYMNSAVSIVNLSLIMISVSTGIALILPVLKLNRYKIKRRSKAA